MFPNRLEVAVIILRPVISVVGKLWESRDKIVFSFSVAAQEIFTVRISFLNEKSLKLQYGPALRTITLTQCGLDLRPGCAGVLAV